MNYAFIYKIKYFKSRLNSTEMVETTECGLIYAQSYPEAVQKLSDWYGEDHLSDINTLIALDEEVIVLPEQITLNIFNDEYYEMRGE